MVSARRSVDESTSRLVYEESSRRRVVRAIAFAALLATAWGATANELRVEPRTLQTSDLVTITVSAEGPFADTDAIDIPVQNLTILGAPSVSSQFQWINGETRRSKTFRYRARPGAPGPAMVGPIVLTSGDGQRDTLPPVALQIVPDRAAGSNDPAAVLRELLAAGRDPLFVVAEADKTEVYVGEPLIVTWWLYNASVVQEWQVASVPRLEEFWTEERPRVDSTERVYVGDISMQRLPVRRAVLIPLQSGTQTIAGMTIDATVMRRTRSGPFAIFEGELSAVNYTSAPLTVHVKPIPPGPPVDATGDLAIQCDRAVQQNGGPVVVRVTVGGNGNLRAATAPHFDGQLPGTLRIEGGEVSVSRDDPFSMTRRWRYLIFPSSPGMLEIPPLVMSVFDPRTATRKELRCAASLVEATVAQPPAATAPKTYALPARSRVWPWVTAALLVLLAALIAVPRIRRDLRLRRAAREIVRDATAQEIRTRLEQRVTIDLNEPTERGDAWRALVSLLAAVERDRDLAVDSASELERRVRDVLAASR